MDSILQQDLSDMSHPIIAICGMPGSGKGELNRLASAAGFAVLSMGDMIRAEAEARGLPETPDNIGQVAISLRAEFGDGILAERMLAHGDAAAKTSSLVFIEGMRGVAEAAVFRRHWSQRFSVLALDCDVETRWLRISARGRGEDGERVDFETREQRELQWGLGTLMAAAEHRISNHSDLPKLEQEFSEFLDSQNA